jgi:hypothetical protein
MLEIAFRMSSLLAAIVVTPRYVFPNRFQAVSQASA